MRIEEIILLLLFGLALIAIAWLIEMLSKYAKSTLPRLFPNFFRRREELLRRRTLMSFDPDWVLERLFSTHHQKISYWDILKVYADCPPYDKEVWGDGPYGFFWFWVVAVRPVYWQNKYFYYAYVVGFFDPTLREPQTILKSWLFRTPEEATMCALKSMEFHSIYKIYPHQKLYDSLKEQVKKGRKIRQHQLLSTELICSVCGAIAPLKTDNYCRSCGKLLSQL